MTITQLFADLLNSPGLQSFVGVCQITLLLFLVRAVSLLQRQIADLHEWHSVKDPARPGAFLWWAASLPDVTASLETITKRLHVHHDKLSEVSDRQRDQQEQLKDITKAQRDLSTVCVRAVNQREHLVG